MQDLIALIEKSLAGTASPAELKELLALLDTEEGQLYARWMQEAAATPGMQTVAPFDQQRIREVLNAAVQADRAVPVVTMNTKRRRINWLKAVAVAAGVAGLIGVGYYYIQPARRNTQQLATQEEPATQRRISAGNIPKTIVLRDSSVVVLYPNSTLEYERSYGQTDRKLRILGKGRFTVQKDPQKPFVVYSKHLATTAIGTVFEVTETGDSTVVCLLEGKVKVENYTAAATNVVFLTAGERAIGTGAAPIAVGVLQSDGIGHAATATVPKKAIPRALSFKQMALAEVFDVLKKRYEVRINYNKAELTGMLFTGTFDGTEKLEVVLRTIAGINDLQVRADQQGFTITK